MKVAEARAAYDAAIAECERVSADSGRKFYEGRSAFEGYHAHADALDAVYAARDAAFRVWWDACHEA